MSVQDFLNHFHIRSYFTATGVVGRASTDPYKILGYRKLRVVVEGVGGSNEIVVRGRLRDQAAYTVLATITGTSAGTTVDITDYEEIYFNCATYSASGTPTLIASGIIGAAAGGGGSAAWGDITGTLADQTDLQSALDAKVSGSGTAGRIAFWSGAGAISSNAGLVYTAPVDGSDTSVGVANSFNTSGSGAYLEAAVAGTSAGDPHLRLTVTSGTSWYAGVDNSASDSFFVGTGAVVGTNPMLRIATDGVTSFYGTGLRFNTGGTAAQVTEIYAGAAGGNDGGLALYGGNGSGAYAILYAASHATLAGVTNFSGTMRLTANSDVFIGSSSGPYSYGFERLGVRLIPSSANAASSHAVAEIQYNNSSNTVFTATQVGVGADWRRSVTASTTDTGALIALNPAMSFTVAAGTTYTNNNASVAALFVSAPSLTLNGTGVVALASYSGIQIGASSSATGTRKQGILIGAQSGATNNANLADNAAYTGSWALNFTSTNASAMAGSLYLGATGPVSFNTEKLSVNDSQVAGAFNIAGSCTTLTLTGNAASSGAGYSVGAQSALLRQMTGTATDTQGGMAAHSARLAFSFTSGTGATYTNATATGVAFYITGGFPLTASNTYAITHLAGFHMIANSVASGTNKYGVRIGDLSGATNNYAFYSGTGQLSVGDYLEFRTNHDPGAPTDAIRISSKVSTDSGTPNTLHLRTEQAVEAIGGGFTASHKHRIWLNNVEYRIQLEAV